jgi:hypothetical protein
MSETSDKRETSGEISQQTRTYKVQTFYEIETNQTNLIRQNQTNDRQKQTKYRHPT